jgi:hypothetical protein
MLYRRKWRLKESDLPKVTQLVTVHSETWTHSPTTQCYYSSNICPVEHLVHTCVCTHACTHTGMPQPHI